MYLAEKENILVHSSIFLFFACEEFNINKEQLCIYQVLKFYLLNQKPS